MRWLPLSLAALWLVGGLWFAVPGIAKRIEKDSQIGQLEDARKRFARSFRGLAKEMLACDKKVQELRKQPHQRILFLTQPGWNPLVSNATYQLYPRQVVTRNLKANPVRNLANACVNSKADAVLYRNKSGWLIYEPPKQP